jgi:phospholipase A-2-activating protein
VRIWQGRVSVSFFWPYFLGHADITPDVGCSQTIVHPAISVWATTTTPNGDIVSGCSDGIVRVFSASEERWTSQAELTEYETKVATQALPAQVVGNVKKSDLPDLEALTTPGELGY